MNKHNWFPNYATVENTCDDYGAIQACILNAINALNVTDIPGDVVTLGAALYPASESFG